MLFSDWLVVSNIFLIFHNIYILYYIILIYGIILPIDELIFFKMVKTTNQPICKS